MEELARLGQRRSLCPYYAARALQQHADLVVLPYSALLVQACAACSSTCMTMSREQCARHP